MKYALKHSTEPLKLWERIEIIVGEGSSGGHYATRIEDFQEHGIVVTQPELESGSTLLSNGCHCLVILTRDDAVYQFGTRIRMLEESHQRLYVIDPPKDVRRVQRRQYVRIDLWEKTRFAIVEKGTNDKADPTDLQWLKGVIVNFSGGGVLLKSNSEIELGSILVLSLDFLNEPGLPHVVAAICRRLFTKDESLMAGLEFLRRELIERNCDSTQLKLLPDDIRSFDLAAQNRLINYVFKQEVELHNKGLL